jgi:hypothetical protein
MRRFEPEHRVPNRRHTGVQLEIPSADKTDRRTTLNVFGLWSGRNGAHADTSLGISRRQEPDTTLGADLPPMKTSLQTTEAVDVDVRTNLDIFGSPFTPVQSPVVKQAEPQADGVSMAPGQSQASSDSTPKLCANDTLESPIAAPLTPIAVVDEVGAQVRAIVTPSSYGQAPTTPPCSPPAAIDRSPLATALDNKLENVAATADMEQVTQEGDVTAEQIGELFTSYCPQGLSPIEEESMTGDDIASPSPAVDTSQAPEQHLFHYQKDDKPETETTPAALDIAVTIPTKDFASEFASIVGQEVAELTAHLTSSSAETLPLNEPGQAALEEDESSQDEDSEFERDFDNATRTNPIYLESEMTEELYDLGEANAFVSIGEAHEAIFSSSPVKANLGDASPHQLVTLHYDPILAQELFAGNAEQGGKLDTGFAGDAANAQVNYGRRRESPSVSEEGFTPINFEARRRSLNVFHSPTPPSDAAGLVFSLSEDDDLFEADKPINTAIDFDGPTIIPPPTLPQEDSDTELLRKFVGRVRADKLNAKEDTAARALLRSKRRSGSMGSTASGSPIGKTGTPSRRMPLGAKDVNSPSPSKKRKGVEDDLKMKEHSLGPAKFTGLENPLFSPSKSKKRKKQRIETDNVAMFDPEYQPTLLSTDAAPRRSTRTRAARIQLRPTAGGVAEDDDILSSMISVRLPGSTAMSDTDISIAMARSRKEEKDLSALTRVNTRKNKGTSVPPKELLGDQSWVAEQTLLAAEVHEDADRQVAKPELLPVSRKAKEVRWAEELVNVQQQVVSLASKVKGKGVFASSAAKAGADVEAELETMEQIDPVQHVSEVLEDARPMDVQRVVDSKQDLGAAADPVEDAAPPAGQEIAEPAPPPLPPVARQTRASRLRAPTPRRSVGASSLPTPVKVKPPPTPARRLSEAPTKVAGSGARKVAASKTATATATEVNKKVAQPPVRMGTRRTKIASLGMGINGTPAPKRRTRGKAGDA